MQLGMHSFLELTGRVKVHANGAISGEQVAKLPFGGILSLLPAIPAPAIISRVTPPSGQDGVPKNAEVLYELTHVRLNRFISQDEAGLCTGPLGLRRGMRVAIAIPNGVEIWVALLQTMCYATAVPVNVDNTSQVLLECIAYSLGRVFLRSLKKH